MYKLILFFLFLPCVLLSQIENNEQKFIIHKITYQDSFHTLKSEVAEALSSVLDTIPGFDTSYQNGEINKGNDNNIEFFLEKDLMLMQGNAEFYQDRMRILSDENHYDLKEDRVLKSVNAKIINN